MSNFNICKSNTVLIILIVATSLTEVIVLRQAEFLVNESSFIGCSSKEVRRIQWHHTPPGKQTSKYVYAGGRFYSPYNTGRFLVDNNSTTNIYTLIIANVMHEDAGLYECKDDVLSGVFGSTHLTVLDSSPVCTSNMNPNGFACPNTCNIEEENITFSCAVSFSGNSPNLMLSLSDGSQTSHRSICEGKDNRINCSLSMKPDCSFDGSTFICQTTSNDARHNCSIKDIRESWNIKFCRQQRIGRVIGLSVGLSMCLLFAVIAFVVIYKKRNKADKKSPKSKPLLSSNANTTSDDINDNTLANAAKEDIKGLLLDRMNPDFGLLDLLLGNGALDRRDFEAVKSQQTSYDRNARLLKIVTRKRKLRELFEALRNSNQEHLVNYVIANGERWPQFSKAWPLTSREVNIINTNQRCLVDSMDVSNNKLIFKLHEVGFLTKRQQDHVCELVHSHQKVQTLLDMLYRSSVNSYYKMIICLQDTNQPHIAKILEGGVVLVDVHNTLSGDTETVDRDEDELVTRIQSLLADTLHDLSHFIAEVFKLFMACKGNSIVLYIFCDIRDDLMTLFKLFDSGELKKKIELDFNKLVSRNDLVIAKTTLPEDNLEKYMKYFEEVPRIDLSEELLGIRKEIEHEPKEVTPGVSAEESKVAKLLQKPDDSSISASVGVDEPKEATTGVSAEESKVAELLQKPDDPSTSASVEGTDVSLSRHTHCVNKFKLTKCIAYLYLTADKSYLVIFGSVCGAGGNIRFASY